jgi:O-antigen/teichoic acid export membrane protein
MLLLAHSGFRYLALLAGLAVILYALQGMATKRAHDRNMKNLAITFRSTMDISLLLGVVMIMTGYGFYNDLGVHILVMVLATVVAHLVPAVMRKRPQAERTLVPYAVATAISLALVVVGTLSLNRPPEG